MNQLRNVWAVHPQRSSELCRCLKWLLLLIIVSVSWDINIVSEVINVSGLIYDTCIYFIDFLICSRLIWSKEQRCSCSLRTAQLKGSYSNYQIKIIWRIWSSFICLLVKLKFPFCVCISSLLNCRNFCCSSLLCPHQDAVEWWLHWSDWSVVGLLVSDVICYRGDVHQRDDTRKFSPKRAGWLAHDTGLRMHWGMMG